MGLATNPSFSHEYFAVNIQSQLNFVSEVNMQQTIEGALDLLLPVDPQDRSTDASGLYANINLE